MRHTLAVLSPMRVFVVTLRHLSLASQHSDVVTSVVTEVHMAAQQIIHAEMEKRKTDM